jgi:predicted methyltransferase MtxX (methanogen marker protein 4)
VLLVISIIDAHRVVEEQVGAELANDIIVIFFYFHVEATAGLIEGLGYRDGGTTYFGLDGLEHELPIDDFNTLDAKAGNIKAAIRGSLSSTDFLKQVSQEFSPSQISRIALLESATGHQFWFAPVGIDEGITYESRLEFIEHAIVLLGKCRIPPNIGILSKGRMGDAKRGAFIKESLKDNQRLVQEIAKRHPTITIAHDEILLENAISKQRNFILAPDGVSGNLIYRTLVHLGKGYAYGAVYCGAPFEKYTIIDTSRVGNAEEIKGAMILALAF